MRELAHLRADQEGVDAAGRRAEMRVMQDHAPEPQSSASPVKLTSSPATANSPGGGRCPKNAAATWSRRRAARLVRAAGQVIARRRRAGDPPAPGEVADRGLPEQGRHLIRRVDGPGFQHIPAPASR